MSVPSVLNGYTWPDEGSPALPPTVGAGQPGPVVVARFVLQDQYAGRGALLIHG